MLAVELSHSDDSTLRSSSFHILTELRAAGSCLPLNRRAIVNRLTVEARSAGSCDDIYQRVARLNRGLRKARLGVTSRVFAPSANSRLADKLSIRHVHPH